MSDTIAPDESVWIATGFSGDDCEKCLHVDPECRNLSHAKSVVEKQRSMYADDQRVCEICTGQYQPHTDASRSAAYLALKEAANE